MTNEGLGAWLPSLNQLERFEFPDAIYRANDFVVRELDIDGDLDLGRLELAMKEMELRHPVLTYKIHSAGASTTLMPGLGSSIPLQISTDAPSVGDEVNAIRDLAGACVRLTVKELASGKHRLSLLADHSIMDARSVSLVFRDLFGFYARIIDGPRVGLEEEKPLSAPWSFGDWTAWERTHVARRRTTLTAFWRRKLADLGPFPDINLPTLSQPRNSEVDPITFTLRLRGRTLSLAEDLAGSRDIPQFAVVSLLIKATILAVRMVGESQTSTVVASFGAFPNRLPRRVEESVGGFANSAVIASDLHESDTLMIAVAREAQDIFLSSCHQDFPHALIVKDLAPDLYGVRYRGSLDEIPHYFNVDMPSANDAGLDPPQGMVIRSTESAPELPRSGLRLIAKKDALWTIEVRYDPQVYSEDLMNHLRVLWATLTDSWLRDPQASLGSVLGRALRAVHVNSSAPAS